MPHPPNRGIALGAVLLSLIFPLSLSAGGVKQDAPPSHAAGRIRLATSTSTDNSGLIADILPAFTDETGIEVDVIAVGTGKALELGRQGDVDVILVHAPSLEEAFVAEGFGVDRRAVMHNDFIILGPPGDPAVTIGGSDAIAALLAIAETKAPFISRGDESGTHTKERLLWELAGLVPSGAWYREAGQAMGAMMTIASEVGGYTMADRGTWLSMRHTLDLVVAVEGDPRLHNPYGIIAVNPDRHRHVNYNGAVALIEWLTSPGGQQRIGAFTVDGEVLFIPDVIVD